MSDWRDMLFGKLTPGVCPVTLAADPDSLILEEQVLAGLRVRGFEVIEYEDPVAFRYVYESHYRSALRGSQASELIVVLRGDSDQLQGLPYDLSRGGRTLSFGLVDLFPKLSYPVVAALDREYLDILHRAYEQHHPHTLGENATKDFILLHVFEIVPQLIKTPVDLLRALMRRHYRQQHIPRMLDERLVQILKATGTFQDWALDEIVPDRGAFFRFLQERWPIFLDRFSVVQHTKRPADGARAVGETTHSITIPGPAHLPLDHDDIRVYLDNFFAEGLLQPVSHEAAGELARSWVAVGMKTDPDADRKRRVQQTLDVLSGARPTPSSQAGEWLAFAPKWSELLARCHESTKPLESTLAKAVRDLRQQVNQRFAEWSGLRFAGLHSQPPMPPVMLHHVPRMLARKLAEGEIGKAALVVVDGLAFHQWIAVRDTMRSSHSWRFSESAVFAWVPTLTSVSRQALFAGKAPFCFGRSIQTTAQEEKLWKQFWQDHGLSPTHVAYVKGGDGGDILPEIGTAVENPTLKVVGVVVNTVDDIMHGMELGAGGMQSQVRQWAESGVLAQAVSLLMDSGFRVFITSDHGNTEATGIGSPQEGVTAETRGQRARIYSEAILRKQVKGLFPDAVEWDPIGLPADFLPLLAPAGAAFAPQGKTVVCHGGLSVEEVIVPLVEVTEGKR